MNFNSIQIELQVTGETAYIMKYPETAELNLELARSAEYWGVFLSIVENFTAIKEDRNYCVEYFEKLKNRGYADDYFLNINIKILEYETYTSIYTGVALPEYEDDTYRINLKFNQNDKTTNLLDGTLEINKNLADNGTQLYNVGLAEEACKTITGYRDDTGLLGTIPIGCMFEGTETQQEEFYEGNEGNKWFMNAKEMFNLEATVNYENVTQNITTETFQQDFTDDINIIIPKHSKVIFAFNMPKFYFWQNRESYDLKYVIRTDNPTIGEMKVQQIGNTLEIEGEIPMTRSTGAGQYYWNVFQDEISVKNNGDENLLVRIAFFRPNLTSDAINWGISYQAPIYAPSEGESGQIYYTVLRDTSISNNTVKVFNVLDILDGFNAVDSTFLNSLHLLVDDSFLNTYSDKNYRINISNLLIDLVNTLSMGVEYKDDSFVLNNIVDMFEDEQSVNIDEANVFNVSTSLNPNFTINTLTLGTTDRNYKYPDSDYDHTREATYNTRNPFSGDLNLTVTNYKAQSNDLCDFLYNYLYDQNEESKEDDNIVFFDTSSLYSGDYNITQAQNSFTPAFQFARWSWLLKTISPLGFDLVDNNNLDTSLQARANVNGQAVQVGESVESGDTAINLYNQKITLRVIKAQIKLNTEQYNTIVANRNKYITINYKDETYKGYINVLSLELGKNMIAEVELLEKFES